MLLLLLVVLPQVHPLALDPILELEYLGVKVIIA
jgi:hypothetical protein